MRENLLDKEFKKLRTPKRKGTEEQGDVDQSGGSASGSRRTRSQAAPDWTAQDLLILVFEISAVEGECANALSSYQKWTMVAQNCAALDVARTSHQCRNKWESLLTEYKTIVEWQKGKKGKSYWSLDSGRRKKAGLPLDFTEDLFKAIDEAVKDQGQRSESDPDTDAEAEFDASNSLETGSKKLRRHSTHSKGLLEEEDEDEDEDESPEIRSAPGKGITKERENHPVEIESQYVSSQLEFLPISDEEFSEELEHESPGNEIVTQRAPTEEIEHIVEESSAQCPLTPCKANTEPEPHLSIPPNGNPEEIEHAPAANKSCYELSPGKAIMEGKEPDFVQIVPFCQTEPNEQTVPKKKNVKKKNGQEKRQLLAAKIQENTELIHAIIAGNSGQKEGNMSADRKYEENKARQNANKLIACIADMAKNLDLLNHAVREGQGDTV